ncbi:hypothetical protein LPJ61_005597 [Coemansia biformis]|uniref:Palmitoyl-protein thioesterase 1 n=1 Tax=Coemansia biformis TaxID=1286918 RepID=A0A9W7Y6G4_9FUNG|nr:hypothetical protein LPJ61_005597 [Coemansia biformis]
MGAITRIIQDEVPGIYVHSVKLGNTAAADRNAGFFGNLNDHVDEVCGELGSVAELQRGVNLMGFSQGGLFLRALVQRCPTLKARTLVTFGSPHGGVARIPECPSEGDFLCTWMRRLASRGVYSWYIRDHVVQAQYFKDPERLDQYLQYNVFLPDINGDTDKRNEAYRDRILALDKMVLVRFSNDTMIYPASSTWFGFVDADGDEVPLESTDLYREDWLGLRELAEDSRLQFVTIDGKHMEIGEELLRSIVSEHFGTSGRAPALRVQG